jgi:hypothetical protein
MNAREKRRRTWARLVEEQISSGKSAAAWCREKSINAKTFTRWKRNLTIEKDTKADPSPEGWCQVKVKPVAEEIASLKLIVNGSMAIELRTGFNHQLLKEVLAVLCP